MKSKRITMHNKKIGHGHPAIIIAEAGVNHNGDFDMAKRMVYEAKACGADCIKFQTFKAERLVTELSPKAPYQLETTSADETQLEMLKKLELSEDEQKYLMKLCSDVGIIFLSTPCNIEDVDFLNSLDVAAFKIASAFAVEPYFLRHIAKRMKPILLSTGMCTLAEVDEAIRIIRGEGNEEIILMQCTTNYPSAIEDANLLAMQTLSSSFDVLVGYSDHTSGLVASTVAVSLGACVIEKHFTLDKNLSGPDHLASADPEEFAQLVKSIRSAETCLGNRVKFPTAVEVKNTEYMRRSIVAKKVIYRGEIFTLDNLTVKRPGIGLPPKLLEFIIGRKAAHDIAPETMIDFGMIA